MHLQHSSAAPEVIDKTWLQAYIEKFDDNVHPFTQFYHWLHWLHMLYYEWKW